MNTAAFTNLAASAAVLSTGGVFYGAILTAGSDAATLTLYDNTAGSGTVICKLSASAANITVDWVPAVRIPVKTGIYATITGTTPSATILWA